MAAPTVARCRGVVRNRRAHTAIAIAHRLPGFSIEIVEDLLTPEPACRMCGCTEMRACPGGCYWIEPDLCSACKEGNA